MDFYIYFEGYIELQTTQKLIAALEKAREKRAQTVHIFFSSLGGSIYQGFMLASMIRNSTIPVSMHATNHIDSVANVIFLSAKRRTSESYAKFYLHGASKEGNFDEKSVRDLLSNLKTNNSRIAYFVSENSKLPYKRVQKLMKNGMTITAQEAKRYEMVAAIEHREIPGDALREDIILIA